MPLLALALVVLPLAQAAGVAADETCPATVAGRYRNSEYGFSFAVPSGYRGEWQSPCAFDENGRCICTGNHGLRINVGNGSVLAVFADYAAELDSPTAGDILRGELDRIAGGAASAPDRHITSVETVRLKGRTGYRVRSVATSHVDDVAPDVDETAYERLDYVFFSGGVRCVAFVRAQRRDFGRASKLFRALLDSWSWASN